MTSTRNFIISLVMILIWAAVLLFFAIRFYQKQLSKKMSNSIYVTGKGKLKVRFLHAAYSFFSSFPLTRRYIRKIRERYEILEPGDIEKTENETIQTALTIWFISIMSFAVGALIDFSIYTILVSGFMAYIISTYLLFQNINKKKKLVNNQLIQFIGGTEHAYFATNMIESAITNSITYADEPIRSHMEKISEIVDSSDSTEQTATYVDNTTNPFLQLFLSACELVNEYDDKIVQGFSLFVRNLNSIKSSISSWLLTQKTLEEKFRFMEILVASPMLFIRPIYLYMVNNWEETAHYYKGPYGIIMSAVICFSVILLYLYTSSLKDLEFKESGEHIFLDYICHIPIIKGLLDAWEDKNYGKTLKLNGMLRRSGSNMNAKMLQIEKIFSMIGMYFLSVFLCFAIVSSSKNLVITTTDSLESSLTYIVDDNDKLQQYVTYSTDLVKGYLDQNITADDIQKVIKSDGTISDDDVIELLANDVVKRIVKYQNTYFKWWYLIICLGIGAVGYSLPLLLLYSRKSLMQMAQENEVTQFQSIICMLMHIPEMTPDVILNWMCRFSNIFRDSLTKCQFRLSAGDTDALEELKEDEPFIPFQRIVDSLIDADRVGVEKAFVELTGDMEVSKKERELDTNTYINKKSGLASMLVFIPLLLLLFGYMIAPMMLTAFGSMNGLNTTIS